MFCNNILQETFLGHTSPISRCRFSATGDNVASASVDGAVRYILLADMHSRTNVSEKLLFFLILKKRLLKHDKILCSNISTELKKVGV